MYMPRPFTVEQQSTIVDVLRRVAFGHLVTSLAGEGLNATALPFVVDDELGVLRAHFSRANDHWESIDGATALMIVPSTDAYISPRWYPSKAEHGKVVPTWNYELIHLYGTIEIHDDPEWTLGLVRDLTSHNEQQLSETDPTLPWAVDDAPPDFIAAQVKAIVGVQLNIERVEAKRKLSQNKPANDQAGAAEGLARSPRKRDAETAALMKSTRR